MTHEISQDNARKYSRILLMQTMGDISEDYWCAGWLQDLEYDLWAFVCGDVDKLWEGVFHEGLNEYQRQFLKTLSTDAGGWFIWQNGREFIEMDQWLEKYAKWKEKGLKDKE